ncbi:phosphoglycerate dehydrogenase [Litoreibacter albidus]|uniref:D-3-phosphoglycerate dehydrogenase n=1 Tax=Litoreibacter albidus TaxID=670155 RepID=A0A1H3CKA0_9RHOB|nr:phosphoglycerate dehydrogenase [Litoreibacter albidus]SDX54682.1 D-3-phosphoglycerate dehydrogenase [Litoreibacter albidus]
MNRIMITPRSLSNGGHPALRPLQDAGFELVMPAPGATPSEQQLLAAVPSCVGWLAGVEPISEAVISAAPHLRVISRNGTGIDNLPMPALEARGIAVRRAEGTNARGVAELALALTFAGLRDIVPTHTGLQQGVWPRRAGHEIQGARIGVVGLGAIGAAFSEFCLALGARVRGFDPFAPEGACGHPNFERTDLATALTDADVVSLHAPMPQDGRPLLGASQLEKMAQGAVVVNTARAGLIDDRAMLAALDSGRVGAYATDVFPTEPPELTALLRHNRVVTTSHIGGFTRQSVERSTRRAVDNLLDVLARHEA